MSWECRLIEYENQTWDDLKVGDMFLVPKVEDEYELSWPFVSARQSNLSEFYHQNNSGRQPIVVVLPGRALFCVDGKCRNSQGSYGGWTVTGVAPFITVQPSINLGGIYHGFLQNGIISDDCEGRQFPSKGLEWDLE